MESETHKKLGKWGAGSHNCPALYFRRVAAPHSIASKLNCTRKRLRDEQYYCESEPNSVAQLPSCHGLDPSLAPGSDPLVAFRTFLDWTTSTALAPRHFINHIHVHGFARPSHLLWAEDLSGCEVAACTYIHHRWDLTTCRMRLAVKTSHQRKRSNRKHRR